MAADTGSDGRGYEGYTDYRQQSERIATAIDTAVAEYARLQRAHAEGTKLRSDDAADASRHILAAALRLLPELRDQREVDEVFDRIVVRWTGDEETFEDADHKTPIEFDDVAPDSTSQPLIEAFMAQQFSRDCPDFLRDFVDDIRTAGWELGYLKAGRHSDEDTEFTEDDVADRFM